ncbi:1-phosphatidylinositol 4-kinase STT4 [Aspergillus chevalieri]|uniref:1-phosphatidylinositol 4-kinase n=1 Tax=Aspergillus chevalieri TaxID=182096 RepID=A0A7R7VN60_ASPCH|nr:phosphatidylinositol-4-kinase [Aspergillus chevalieri]BCR87686.1 phosphatidylinositol-4-kinase [Aspergillus chevalieri]
MDDFPTNIRHSALEKLANLAVQESAADEDSDITRLTEQCQRRSNEQPNGLQNRTPTSRVPMGIRELDVLFCLCKASSSVKELNHASRLVAQLSQYLPESHSQVFRASPFLQNVKPSPWESLTYNLATALLSLGANYPSLRDTVFYAVNEYLCSCAEAVDAAAAVQSRDSATYNHGAAHGSVNILSIVVSLVGFLEASAVHTSFWTASEQLQIVEHLRLMLSERLMVNVETASSIVRNASATDPLFREWRKYSRRYAAHGRPLGAILLQEGLMRFVKSCALSLIGPQESSEDELLDEYMNGVGIARSHGDAEISLIECVTKVASDEIHLLEDGFDYLQLGSPWQQRLTFSVKALALTAFLNCVVVGRNVASSDTLLSWLEDTLTDPNQMSCVELGTAALRSVAIIARMSPNSASAGTRSLLRFIVQGGVPTGPIIAVAARCLAQVLSILSQDAVITTLYSLGNVLSAGSNTDRSYQNPTVVDAPGQTAPLVPFPQPGDPSVISLSVNGEEDNVPHRNVIHAIVTIANSCNDEKISALAQSMLLQKMGKVNAAVDACLIQETAALAPSTGQAEFQLLLKFYARVYREGVARGGSNVAEAVQSAMSYLSITLSRNSPLYRIYLIHLLESIVNKGDATDLENERQREFMLTPGDIVPLLRPLALLVSSKRKAVADSSESEDYDEDVSSMFRDVWFNLAVHGISANSTVARDHMTELRLLAKHSPPLVPESRMEMLESDVELNTILRRGMGPQRILEQKKMLITEIANHEPEIKRLDYPRVIFLNASLLLESLRASSGNCTKFLSYFRDPALATIEMASCMNAIAENVVSCYLTMTLSGKHEEFSVPFLSKQLADFFVACCHRIERVQNVAVLSANKIIRECPSALCEKHSLFALLELLTVMWSSCLEEDLDEFEWKSSFTSPRGIVKVDLPDNYGFRRGTLEMFHERAKAWVATVMDIAPLDVKGLLQTYLSESEDDGGYGHISLGRSFALDMGSFIPQSDRRLGSIENYGINRINVASEFVAQYSSRQKYRYPVMPALESPGFNFAGDNNKHAAIDSSGPVENVESLLSRLYEQANTGKNVSFIEVRDVLRQAAAILCSEKDARPSIVHYFVALPFQIFSKESMSLGVSLWLGTMNENPEIESRIMVEVMEGWEETIRRRRGLFNPSFDYVDPLYAKIELLPTDKELLLKKQQKAQNILSPHSHVLQFFESHFSAVRLGKPQSRRLFCRLIGTTTVGLLETHGHPLAREIHFRITLFGLKVLKHFNSQDQVASWKLKDQILSAALSWFKHPPRWSFGGNRLQLKAEDKILDDVASALKNVAGIAGQTHGPYKSLHAKQELLQMFIENERSRLKVWLYPLEPERKHFMGPASGGKNLAEEAASLLWLAWEENPGLAIQLATRLSSAKLRSDIRWLLLNFSEKALDEANGLEIMFGSSLPPDVSSQLKYLLYWAPVNPTEALTYFLPAYGNHPFILQYAMKALESHPVDVRFYFVPQLVQALRYDTLGYVERYILETAKQSQLFAHQVIWNMKANSYKDEDAQVPDPLKPTLDKFMEALISSFSDEEREFYEREFSFFNDITGISGKLRPYIKKSKPEKKEKIEEELRKIKVEVGVYLPSNPDGAVVGIDRKSGKPLQSHAKAPYMATFRIQKTRVRYDGPGTPDASGAPGLNQQQLAGAQDSTSDSNLETYDVWQSAIFKVGDDCRQDMLALQMIAAFRSIFSSVGLDVWVFPYRVTSTAPGCGVIDVLPNSISRDMLGREAVNGLYDYFVSKYGGEDSIRFQEARTNFVKSMAAYSLITYLLQFKDRHNGNIMVDDAGHIIHIDFGFCFDIAPGGVRFERAPFKLTSEMIAVMGGIPQTHANAAGTGSHHITNTQPYRWFESLVVKAFLASRPYCTKLTHIVSLMLDSGLPCFKPDTLKNFRDRFVLEKSEREAAEFMRELIRKSYMNISTKGYDQFQLLTNGIPY